MPKDKRTQVAEALNWLEQYFPEFNDMIYEIRQGQKAGKLEKIRMNTGTEAGYQFGTDELSIDFNEQRYLGIDNKIYEASLQEFLVHELEHAAQKARPEFEPALKALLHEKIRLNEAEEAAIESLNAYLENRDVAHPELYTEYAWKAANDPVDIFEHGSPDAAILNDPTYKKLAQEWVTAKKSSRDIVLPIEDLAIDRTNILAEILGKSARGNHTEPDLSNLQPENGTLLVYHDAPSVIRKQTPKTWNVDKNKPMPPVFHGEQGVMKSSLGEMQQNWNDTHNADTKNISADEWQVIEKVQGALLPPEILEKISPAEKKKIDAVIDTLKKTFNSTAGNDALDEASQKLLREKGLGSIVEKTSQPGWKL